MFESKADVKLWGVGSARAVALKGNGLRWYCWGNESTRWVKEIALPHGVNPGDVVGLDVSNGLTVLTKSGDMFFRDFNTNRWIVCGNALHDGTTI